MPQETNLNVAPYFDDFDPQSNYYKVLFKPGYPVQARELNNLQSILQNQTEDIATHIFKEGAKVIPGQTSYLSSFYAIQVESEFLGIPVSLYADQLVGKSISGETSGVTGKIVKYISDKESDNDTWTFYIDYFESSTTDLTTQTFFDNEVLLTEDSITFATTFISAGEGFAKTLAANANAVGSAFALNEGIYFLRGTFVDVYDDILILDQYNNTPSYRIGLTVSEDIISADIDPSLTDNAQGFNNFTAPGADRFEIKAVLSKKEADDYNDQNFVQLAEVQNGILREINTGTDYNILGDELARRTFDESGHYYVRDFLTTVKESLNNETGNGGIYLPGQTTQAGNTPNDDLGVYKIGPGKAYVRGYEVDVTGPTFVDFQKPRTTKNVTDQAINFGFGPTFTVNNSYGAATIGFNTTNTLSLRSERVGSDQQVAPGKEIGIARIWDYDLESGSYNSTPALNEWDLSLFDIQTYTDLTVNTAVTLNTPTFVQGQSSGATGYLRNSVSAGTAFTCYDVKGEFFVGENLHFNGVSDNARSTISVDDYEISDVQSVYGIVGTAATFTADMIPQVRTNVGLVTVTPASGGISTVTTPTTTWPGIVTTGNLVQYQASSGVINNTVLNLARVASVSTNSITIEAVENVTGFRNGALPTAEIDAQNFSVVETKFQSRRGGQAADTLFSIFPKKNIESVDLDNATINIRKEYSTTITNNATSSLSAGADEVFLPYDEERYTLVRSDGTMESLSADKFNFTDGSNTLTIDGLGTDDSASTLVATLRKSQVTNKIKTKNIVTTVLIDKSNQTGSGIGGTTLNDGLVYGDFPFGTRVQDPVICLNVPDANMLYGVFESENTDDPVPPSMTCASMDGATGTTNDLIIGESITGAVSGAKALYLIRKNDTQVNFIYTNSRVFEQGEVITFDESGVAALASNVNVGSKNIISAFDFGNGQRSTIYDYARIIRKVGVPTPTKKLVAYFMSSSYAASDTGDITTVSSYDDFDYGTEIPSINGLSCSDIIDARPRVTDYTVAASTRSPFEFDGRVFDGDQHSSKNVLASEESITLGYDYYLGRMDRIYLDKDGIFTVKEGSPDDNPTLPEEVSGCMNVANVALPPYLYFVENARVTFIDHKRYQMSDISKLEQRIKNLEYYTSLNQIESTTLNLFVPDANGLNRYKSGIYVDNFSSTQPQDTTIGFRNSIDRTNRVMRPTHYTTSFNLQIGNTSIAGIGTTTAPNQDSRYADILGTNVRRSQAQTVTLDYSETSWLRQPFATRSESVTPFLVRFWNGSLFFEPTVDVWIDVNRMELRDVLMEGSFQGVAEAMRAEITTAADGTRSGVSPVIWRAWETTGVDVSFSLDSSQSTQSTRSWRQGTASEFIDMMGNGTRDNWTSTSAINHMRNIGGNVPGSFRVQDQNDVTSTTISGTVGVDLQQQRTGSQTTVTQQIDTQSLGDRIVSRNIVHFMRSRNIEFTARRMKPFTQVYPFFDNVDVARFCFSKLIEIRMVSGTFQVGEAVGGIMPSTVTQRNSGMTPGIVFRVATPNHKYGPYNNPTDRFERNPYNREVRIPATYSETSTLLNCDTFSLAEEERPEFSGYIARNMILRGANSGAHAVVTDVRLVTDRLGTLIGSYRVPSGSDASNPQFETGRSRLRLTSSPINSRVEGTVTTSAEEVFYSQGDIDNTQQVTLSLRNARVTHNDNFRQTRTIGDSASASTTFQSGSTSSRLTGEYLDPLAQSFMVNDETGVYITSCDIFFHEKDTQGVPVTMQIRDVELGQPSQRVLAYSEVDKQPDEITTSLDASVATKFTFPSPVFLNGQREYAIIILSNSTEYRVWISRLGESDVSTLGREEGQALVSTQRLLGSLYKSQNASVWTPSQYEDLTFELHRADFVSNGSVQFFNPSLNTELEEIPENAITMQPNTIRVGLGTTVADTGLVAGNTITQTGTTGSGSYVGAAGSATGTLTVTNVGAGYTPSAAYYVFTGVALTSYTGKGINATADIAINNGVAIAATISAGGIGYALGDVLQPITVGNQALGGGMKLTVAETYGNNELIITDVQGEFGTGAGEFLNYQNSAGVTTTLNYSVGGAVLPVAPIREDSDGLHVRVHQRNHGMHGGTDYVTLSRIQTNDIPVTLSADYSNSATSAISIASTDNYALFENVGVAATNPGYVKVGGEVIKYTGFSGSTLTGITRGIDNTLVENHSATDLVYKYELNGVSLRRINATHQLSAATIANPNGLDYYHIKIDMSDTDRGTNRSGTGDFQQLKFNETAVVATDESRGTYNVPFEMIVPNFNVLAPTGTNTNSSVRTISGQSIDGTEAPFLDKGFQGVALNVENYFDSPRIVASQINENTYLGDLPGKKSFTMNVNLVSDDSRISPSIDLDQSAIVFVSNRINAPITDFKNDYRVNGVSDDPNRYFYVTKNVVLENPATSLQVFLDGYVNTFNDLRVFYALNQEGNVNDFVFVPFPGFLNQNSSRVGVPLSRSENDGTSDVRVQKVDVLTTNPTLGLYKEYKFTADNLPPFESFRIKIIGTSTNQAVPPQVRNFRSIALA